MVKSIAQIEEALSQEVNRGNFSAVIKETPDGFSYIEWHESNRIANKVFGFLGWSSQVIECKFEEIDIEVMVNDQGPDGKPIWETNSYGKSVPRKHPEQKTFYGFKSIVRVLVHAKDEDGDIVTSYHDGVGFGPVTQQGAGKNPMDTAAKAAKSDGLSTAFKHFGDMFGLFLYTKDAPSYSSGTASSSTTTQASTAQASNQGSGSQDVGPRPSAAQLRGLTSIGLTEGQVATIPFKVWKAMLDDLWNKDQSKRLKADQILTKYEIVRQQASETQQSNYPWQQTA